MSRLVILNSFGRRERKKPYHKHAGVSAVHDASFMQQINEGSQYGYMLLGSADMFDRPCKCHLLDWSSSKIARKVRSTLAAESASASRAYDRATFLRYMMTEIEQGRQSRKWQDVVRQVPMALATDCKSLYDLCKNDGKLPDERRVALDLLDVREGIQEMHDQFRWIPTDHMLADALTKRMPPDLMLKFLKDNVYCLKYDDEITNTKRYSARARKEARLAKMAQKSNTHAAKQGQQSAKRV